MEKYLNCTEPEIYTVLKQSNKVCQWDLIRLMQELCRVIQRVIPRNGSQECVHELCDRYLKINLDPASRSLPTSMSLALTVLYAVTIVFALIGNTCVILIFARNRSARTTANLFIVSLAVSDLLITAFCMPINLSFVHNLRWHLGDFACRFVPFIQNIAVQSSSHTLVLIALDRFVAIMYPMKIHYIHATNAAVVLLSAVWMTATLLAIPNFYFFKFIKFDECTTLENEPLEYCLNSQERRGPLEIYRWCMLFLIFLAPLFVMVVCYARIGHRLWSRDGIGARIGHMEEARRRIKQRVVLMLILVVGLFFCCWLPNWTFEMIALRTRMEVSPTNLSIRCFLLWLAISNSAHNPIVYTFLHEKFRRLFLPTFGCGRNRIKPSAKLAGQTYTVSRNADTMANSNSETGKQNLQHM